MESTSFTKLNGCPFFNYTTSMSCGKQGPVSISDVELLEKSMEFAREKIPARNVHALGTGCYGTLKITSDEISKYSKAKLFQNGNTSEVFTRFSGIFTEQGDADTTRDPRGMAMKFYTEEGNWDLLGINTPVFSVRDLKLGPDNVHAFKRDPRNGNWNPDQFWDYIINHPESAHQIMMLFTDRIGTPLSYRTMHSYGCHTFSLVNDKNERFWVKFHLKSLLGGKGLNVHDAKILAGEDPNFLSKDLYQAIEKGNFPIWKFYFQVMKEDEGFKHSWTFDPTKVWCHKDYPLIEIGELELNRNIVDYFSEVEQAAFSPSNLVPGIGVSPDKLLQGRLFLYDSAQYHRIGPNYKKLEINCPHACKAKTNFVGGAMNTEIVNKFPHYHPSIFAEAPTERLKGNTEPPLKVDGDLDFYGYECDDEDYFGQVRKFLNVLSNDDLDHLYENLSVNIHKIECKELTEKVIEFLGGIDEKLVGNVKEHLEKRKSQKSENEKIYDMYKKELQNLK